MTDTPETTDMPETTEIPETTSPAPTVAPPAEPGAAKRVNRRKTRDGVAVSAKMDKTVVVSVVERVRHARYQKTLQRTKRLYAHDEANEVREGDRVRVQETRPMSRTKRWRIVEILERAR